MSDTTLSTWLEGSYTFKPEDVRNGNSLIKESKIMIIILQKSKMGIFCVLHKERKRFNELQNSNNHDKESKEDTMAKKGEDKKGFI